MKYILSIIIFLSIAVASREEQLYVNPKTGNDANTGTKQQPLKTINEAARRVNINKTTGATEIILTEGLHLLTETALFNNNKYTEGNRLVIRAEIMPDDADWNPQQMPVVMTIVPLEHDKNGEEAKGIQVEVSHATIEGIRFSGSPNYSYIDTDIIRRSYPIWRDGRNLDDLMVTQCLFAGDPNVMPLHLGVIANGQRLVVDHCVFYNCKNSVVFWNAVNGQPSNGNAMRYCIVYGNYFSGVWATNDTNGDDFDFHHNIIANCKIAWVREKSSERRYRLHDCIFTNDTHFAAYASGPSSPISPSTTDFLTLNNITTSGNIQIETDQSKRNYLQLAEGSYGSDLKAGLFKK